MRFFTLSKSTGYFLNRLGMASSLIMSTIQPIISAVGGSVSILGTAIGFTAEDLEVLVNNILPSRNQLNVLLEKDLGDDGIVLDDCRNDMAWSACLKAVDILFKRKIHRICATFDATLGVSASILYLVANTHKNEKSTDVTNMSSSMLAGLFIGAQSIIHYFAGQELVKIRHQTIELRHELDLLEHDRQFLLWKIEILQRNKQRLENKLNTLTAERAALIVIQVNQQEELQQKEETLDQLYERRNNTMRNLENTIQTLQTRRRQLRVLQNTAGKTLLQSEIRNLEQMQTNEEMAIKELDDQKQSLSEKCKKLRFAAKANVLAIENQDRKIAAMEEQRGKLIERIDSLRHISALEESVNSLRTNSS